MELQEWLDWAFQRHLNPISWYIRPLFLVGLCYFAYKRNVKAMVITFLVMTSSMVWFPPPETIDPQMEKVLAFEQKVLSSPGTAALTLGLMISCLALILWAFWQGSLKIALVVLNILIVGKLILSLVFTGMEGWGTFGVTVFGLLLVNIIAWAIYRRNKYHE